jgi:hypothetical protein
VFADLYKLALGDAEKRFFLYMADPMIATHWRRQEPRFLSAQSGRPMVLDQGWLLAQHKTLRATVRRTVGFLPEQVALSAWVKASALGRETESWILAVE